MKLEDFCTMLRDTLASSPSADARLEAISKLICQAFSVKPDEVALFSLDPDRESLSFLWPKRLQKSGAVPLSVTNSLVAQTVRSNQAFLDNCFASTPHASIFELFKAGSPVEKPLPIQKIMSVPFGKDGVVTGVIQLSRKAEDQAAAGRDFTRNELLALQRSGEIIACYIGEGAS